MRLLFSALHNTAKQASSISHAGPRKKVLGSALALSALLTAGCQGMMNGPINADGEMLAAGVVDSLPICYLDRQDPYVQLINSSQALSRFYQTVAEEEDIVATLPQVNFNQASIIVAGLGQQPTAGYQINYLRSNRVYRTNNNVDVTVATSAPEQNAPVAAVVTSPCVLIEVEKLENDSQIRLFDQDLEFLTRN